MILSAKKFNASQEQDYQEHLEKLKINNIEPRKNEQNHYFPKVNVNYGYVYKNRFGEIHWRKRKSDFNLL